MNVRPWILRVWSGQNKKNCGHVPPKAPPLPPSQVQTVNVFDGCALDKYVETSDGEDALIRAINGKSKNLP